MFFKNVNIKNSKKKYNQEAHLGASRLKNHAGQRYLKIRVFPDSPGNTGFDGVQPLALPPSWMLKRISQSLSL